MTSVAPTTPAAAPVRVPARDRGAIEEFLADVDSLFVPPVAKPDVAERARRTIAGIDWSNDTIVIWVPGTSDHGVDLRLAELLASIRGAPRAVAVDYQATWRMLESVTDGEAALRAVLELIKVRRRPGQRVVLLGESQGSWVISNVLRDPSLARIVHRAGLASHPGMAPTHAHGTARPAAHPPPAVREFNGGNDFVTRDFGDHGAAALAVVDAVARLEVARALGGAISLAFRAPSLLAGFVSSQLFRMRGETNPHDASTLLADAVRWALDRR